MISVNMQASSPSLSFESEAHASSHIEKSSIVSQEKQKTSQPKQELTPEKSQELAKELNQVSQSLGTDIKFGYNEKIEEMVISVMDKNTGREITKLPTEQAIKLKETMKDFIGSLFDVKG